MSVDRAMGFFEGQRGRSKCITRCTQIRSSMDPNICIM